MAAKSYSRGRPAAQPASSFLTRLAGFVLHHRKRVMAAWGVLFIAGMVAAGAVSNRLSFDFSLPGQPGFETADGKRRATATATLAYEPARAGERTIVSRRFEFTAPLGPIEAADLKWYLETYYLWPVGVFRNRAEAIEGRIRSDGGVEQVKVRRVRTVHPDAAALTEAALAG